VNAPLVGVLALQGAFVAHQQRLAELDIASRQVRTPADLDGIDALVMPGGESTTMSKLLTSSGLFDDLKARMSDGLAVFGTCAGMILLATDVIDGRPDQRSFGMIDLVVRRNGYGRQVESFEADLVIEGLGVIDGLGEIDGLGPDSPPFHGVFIRAPMVESAGDAVEVLALHEGVPVLARQGRITVASFHPELTADHRLHAQFVKHI
jgi:pyridoxal 5'-phosphate synthase pdxT subunit